ncbi:MAG: TIGR03663 family protein [Deltaproteobacteria bacterium]|nr:MAG: TIGR03663 family protein [Deltaproteobacteria bacterium]
MTENKKHNEQLFWILLGIIIFLGIFARFYMLADRPFHHDESLNAIYGRYFYNHPTSQFYKYDPMLHGPFLYNLYPFFYQILDESKATARLVMALMGSFLIFLPFMFRRYLNKTTLFLATLFIASSPTLVYWSRFVRHDPPVLICLAMLIMGWFSKSAWKKSFLWTWGLILPFTIKENAYVHVAIFLGYLVYEFLLNALLKLDLETLAGKAWRFCKDHPGKVFVGLISVCFIYVVLYSAWFRHPDGILDGIYRKSLAYWLNQHHKDRIAGPFIFQFLMLSWYEQVFILMIFLQTAHFYLRRSFQIRGTFVALILMSIIAKYLSPLDIPSTSLLSGVLKIKISLDFYPFILLLGHSLIMTTVFLVEKKRDLALTGYLFTSFFFTYSLVGEKVPWLSVYPLFMGILFLTVYVSKETSLNIDSDRFLKVSAIVLALFQIRIMIMTNYSRAGADTEFISQVHTSRDYEKVAFQIREEIQSPIGHKPLVMAMEHNTWPLTWYLYGLEQYNYIKGNRELNEFDYVLTSTSDSATGAELKRTHTRNDVSLRHWWLPDYKRMTFWNFLNYALHHNPWTPPGKMDISVYKKVTTE